MMGTARLQRWWRGVLLTVIALAPAGCRLECDADAGNDVENVVDEIGDETEDVVDKLKEDKP